MEKVIISWKKAQKVDFRKLLDPFWGFTLKTVLGIHDPRISWLPFGTKNHEMRGPPVLLWHLAQIDEVQTLNNFKKSCWWKPLRSVLTEELVYLKIIFNYFLHQDHQKVQGLINQLFYTFLVYFYPLAASMRSRDNFLAYLLTISICKDFSKW